MRLASRMLKTVVAAAIFSAATVVAMPGSASAGIDPNCTIRWGGPVVLFYGQGQTGASICLKDWIYDMASPALYFPYNGEGGGTRVWDNAGSVANYDTGFMPRIWENPGYWGASFNPAYCCDYGSAPWSLGSVTNKNSSLSWTS